MTDVRCRSILLRRQTAFRFTFSADVTVSSAGEAGITCYYDENSFLTLHASETGTVVLMQSGLERTEQRSESIMIQPGQTVRLAVETDGLRRRFYVNGVQVADFDDVTCLADEGVRIGKRFTGAMVGIYALKGTADFANIAYRAQD